MIWWQLPTWHQKRGLCDSQNGRAAKITDFLEESSNRIVQVKSEHLGFSSSAAEVQG